MAMSFNHLSTFLLLLLTAIAAAQLDSECEISASGSASGDPHFIGFRGQKFDWHGSPWGIFNLITDVDLNVNGRFVPDPRWTNGQTVIAALGIRTAGGGTLMVQCMDGEIAASLGNGEMVLVNNPIPLGANGLVAMTRVDGRGHRSVIVDAGRFQLAVSQQRSKQLPCFLSLEASYVDIQSYAGLPLPDGVLGRTTTSNSDIPTTADEPLFRVESGDLLSTEFPRSIFDSESEPVREIIVPPTGRKLFGVSGGSSRTLFQHSACGCMDSTAVNYDLGAMYSDESCVYVSSNSTEMLIVLEGDCASFDESLYLQDLAAALNISVAQVEIADVTCGSTHVLTRIVERPNEKAETAAQIVERFLAEVAADGSGGSGTVNPGKLQTFTQSGLQSVFRAEVSKQAPMFRRRINPETKKSENPCDAGPCGEGACRPVAFDAYQCHCADGYELIAQDGGSQTCMRLVLGCTNPLSPEFDFRATKDDGSCSTALTAESLGTGTASYDLLKGLRLKVISGCTNPKALNFNPDATVEDFSCVFNLGGQEGEDIIGCTDQSAANYNPLATIKGACEYPGCPDPSAINYDPKANIPSTCEYLGCTDPTASNYDARATVSDSTACKYDVLPSPPPVNVLPSPSPAPLGGGTGGECSAGDGITEVQCSSCTEANTGAGDSILEYVCTASI